MLTFNKWDRVLLSTSGLPDTPVTNFDANKLAPRYIGPFRVVEVHIDAYTLDIPTTIRLHPTFYVGTSKLASRRTSLRVLIALLCRPKVRQPLTTAGTKSCPIACRLVLLRLSKSCSLKLAKTPKQPLLLVSSSLGSFRSGSRTILSTQPSHEHPAGHSSSLQS